MVSPLPSTISLVAAMSSNGVIGFENRIPWYLPEDMRFFKNITLHKPVVMGRKTHESIGRPLAQRSNIVLTRNQYYTAKGCIVLHDIDHVFQAVENEPELMVIGGSEIYQLFLPYATRLYLTHVEVEIDGDVKFPKLDLSNWKITQCETHEADEQHCHRFHITTYEQLTPMERPCVSCGYVPAGGIYHDTTPCCISCYLNGNLEKVLYRQEIEAQGSWIDEALREAEKENFDG